MSDLTDAEKRALPCFKNPGPWQDTSDVSTLKWAARQCVTSCTQRDWCEGERMATLDEFKIAVGVWSGRIWTHRECHVDPAAHPSE